MKKNICFSSIFDLTAVQYEMATRLERHGHSCFWMTTSRRWTEWLLNKGASREKILELVFDASDFLAEEVNTDVIHEIVLAETRSHRTVNMAMMADRFVMSSKEKNINNMVCLYYKKIKDYLTECNIEVVFAEPTNLNEQITALVCNEIGIHFIYPQDLRIPSKRFFFELGFSTGKMISTGKGTAEFTSDEFLKSFREKCEHPIYFNRNNQQGFDSNKFFRILINRARSIRFSKSKWLIHHRFIDRISEKLESIVNRLYIDRIYSHDELHGITGKIAFFGLHVQPEASIDVAGPYFSDQLKLIKDMRRSLPFDTTLVVKEHPNFLGKKSIRFFRELKRIPNVCIVNPQTSTFDIYKRASLVLTVSGTIAYEAAMLRIPAIMFSQQFFNGFSSIHYCADVTQLKPLALRLLRDPQVDESTDVAYMDWIIKHSYTGYWTDPFTDPSVMSTCNLDALFVGFLDVLEGGVLLKKVEG